MKNKFRLWSFLQSTLLPSGLSLLFILTLGGCGSQPRGEALDRQATLERLWHHLNLYEEGMEVALERLEGSDDVEAIREANQALVDLSVPILDDYMLLFPESTAYLRASKRVLHQLYALSEEAIERDYHDGARLPDRPDDGGASYHVKDLLVHPATVLILLRDHPLEDRRVDMLHEIERNQSHLEFVRRVVRAARDSSD